MASLTNWQVANRINYGRTRNTGWARFSVRSSQSQTLWLELTSHFIDTVNVWISFPKKELRQLRGPVNHRQQATSLAPVKHRYFLYALELPAQQTITVWIRGKVVPGDVLKFGVTLWQPIHFLADQQQVIWSWAIFVGIVLAILGAVLISSLFHLRKIYLFYGSYVLCMAIYALLNDGWGVFLPESMAWLDKLSSLMYWINFTLGFFVLFTRHLLAISPIRYTIGLEVPVLFFNIIVIYLAEWANQHQYATLVGLMHLFGHIGFLSYGIIWVTYVIDAFTRRFQMVWLLLLAVSIIVGFLTTSFLLINLGFVTSPIPDMVTLRIAFLVELFVLSVAWLYRRRLLQIARNNLVQQNQQLQAQIIKTQDTERQRIAADLHDDLGGVIATINHQLTQSLQVQSFQELQQKVAQIQPVVDQAGDKIRIIAHNLMPPDFERIGLLESAQQLVYSLNDTRFRFATFGETKRLSPEVELNAYRILSELIHNVQKHAQAKHVLVQLLFHEDQLSLIVEDDGLGNTLPQRKIKRQGIGLKSIAARVNYLPAHWHRSVSEQGTTSLIEIPYTFNADQ